MDADLIALQEVRDRVAAASVAFHAFASFTQQRVDRICEAIAEAGERAARTLAVMAVDETGMGRIEDKVKKNLVASRAAWDDIRSLKTCGLVESDPERGVYTYAVPYGVVAGIIPTTNPSSTALFKALIAVKARNAIVISPHPRAKRCIAEAVRIVSDAALAAGAPEGLISCLSDPTLESTRALMRHPDTALILATGGTDLVREAYSSGKPAYGVGPGNCPAFIERTADVPRAVATILHSKTFDYGTVCASEQSVVIDEPVFDAALDEFMRQKAHVCSPDETAQLNAIVMTGRRMNPAIVGQAACKIASMAGFDVPRDTSVLLVPLTAVGWEQPCSLETLCPILGLYRADGWRAGCAVCMEILSFGGMGHSLALHTADQRVVHAFAVEKPASRIMVNAPASQGSIGFATNLDVSLTLGCGAYGGNITSDNVTARHLLNWKRVAYVKPESVKDLPAADPAAALAAGFPAPDPRNRDDAPKWNPSLARFDAPLLTHPAAADATVAAHAAAPSPKTVTSPIGTPIQIRYRHPGESAPYSPPSGGKKPDKPQTPAY